MLLLHAQLPELGVDLRLHKVLVAVVGIVGGLEGLVVEAVASHPLVNAALNGGEILVSYLVSWH